MLFLSYSFVLTHILNYDLRIQVPRFINIPPYFVLIVWLLTCFTIIPPRL